MVSSELVRELQQMLTEQPILMTRLLQHAIAELQKLSETEQDAIAALILAELEDEERWDTAFANSQEQLTRLAKRVRDDIRAGRVQDTGMDEL